MESKIIQKDGLKIEILKDYNKRNKNKAVLEDSFEEKVALIKFYPGQSGDIVDYYLKQGYKGLVIEMSGLGHVLTEGNGNWVSHIKEAVSKGMVICAAPQTLYGRLDPKVYSPGRELEKAGVIYLKDILGETAFVKLGWVLGKLANKEIKNEDVEELLLKNISKEFNDRLNDEFI
jgi:glutamyl-tRNA(Gln) amidotransferase subunit D